MEQESFAIFSFGEAIANLKAGHDVMRDNIRLRLKNDTIMMIVGKDIMCPWFPVHKDILATDWRVIRLG